MSNTGTADGVTVGRAAGGTGGDADPWSCNEPLDVCREFNISHLCTFYIKNVIHCCTRLFLPITSVHHLQKSVHFRKHGRVCFARASRAAEGTQKI
jgi:hypothetical protein